MVVVVVVSVVVAVVVGGAGGVVVVTGGGGRRRVVRRGGGATGSGVGSRVVVGSMVVVVSGGGAAVVEGTSATGVGVCPALLGSDGSRNRVAMTAAAADTPPILTSIAGLRPDGGALRTAGGALGVHGRSGDGGRGGAPIAGGGAGLLVMRWVTGAANCGPGAATRRGPLPLTPGPCWAAYQGMAPVAAACRAPSRGGDTRAGIAPVAVTPTGCSDSAAPLAIAFFGSASTATGRPSCSETSCGDQRDPRRAADQQHRRQLVGRQPGRAHRAAQRVHRLLDLRADHRLELAAVQPHRALRGRQSAPGSTPRCRCCSASLASVHSRRIRGHRGQHRRDRCRRGPSNASGSPAADVLEHHLVEVDAAEPLQPLRAGPSQR